MELIRDLVARAARAVALGVATLDHEPGDDAVEGRAVVEPLADQAKEVRGGLWDLVLEDLRLDVAEGRVEGHYGVGHAEGDPSRVKTPWVGSSEVVPDEEQVDQQEDDHDRREADQGPGEQVPQEDQDQ